MCFSLTLSDSKNVDLFQASSFHPILMTCIVVLLLSEICCALYCWQKVLQGSTDIWRKHLKLTNSRQRYVRLRVSWRSSSVCLYTVGGSILVFHLVSTVVLCGNSLSHCPVGNKNCFAIISKSVLWMLAMRKSTACTPLGLFPVSCLTPGFWVYTCVLFHNAFF